MSLFAELKRRNVFKVGIAYAVVAWLVLQVSDVILNNIEAPGWVFGAIMLVLGIGFPVVLLFAWAFELTPEGLKREHEVDRSQSITHETSKRLNTTILVLMALAIVYLLIDKLSGGAPQDQNRPASTPAAGVADATAAQEAEPAPDSTPQFSRQSIAVLPFDNRSRLEEDEFFVEGVHDDLLTSLARIGSLKVISRTSVSKYRDTEKTIPEIAQELGVATVMEGAVQRSGNTVRINVQLIDAQTDEHLWAEIFDRELTAENLFAIQSEISTRIATALQATLSPDEEKRINALPTGNLAAYEAYVRGRQLMLARQSAKLQQANEEFRSAVELDPRFALAWVSLSESFLLISSYGTMPKPEAIAAMEEATEKALAIDDGIGEAYASLGQIHNFHQRYEEAEAAYKKAIELSPSYATAWHWYANLLSEFPTRAHETLEKARHARELDPRSPVLGNVLSAAYEQIGQYGLAENEIRRVIELEPGFAPGHHSLADLLISTLGRFDEGVRAARRAAELDPGNPVPLGWIAIGYLNLNEREAAADAIEKMEALGADHIFTITLNVMHSSLYGSSQGTLEAVQWALPRVESMPFASSYMGITELVLGDPARALEIFQGTEPGWRQPDRWADLAARDPFDACVVSWLNLATGAAEEGRQLLELATHALDEILPSIIEHVDIWAPEVCYLTAGDTARALNSIETQLAHRHLFNWADYHRMPMYDPIRDEPRYQAALAERQRIIAKQREQLASIAPETGP